MQAEQREERVSYIRVLAYVLRRYLPGSVQRLKGLVTQADPKLSPG
ncbi:MAG: hypothetical protein QOE54_7071 [Streptosporangiaceae bacterium]|jgi:hypothetical protein|nr:hypothetical protein [Streptosporangiaceae bacterium]